MENVGKIRPPVRCQTPFPHFHRLLKPSCNGIIFGHDHEDKRIIRIIFLKYLPLPFQSSIGSLKNGEMIVGIVVRWTKRLRHGQFFITLGGPPNVRKVLRI